MIYYLVLPTNYPAILGGAYIATSHLDSTELLFTGSWNDCIAAKHKHSYKQFSETL